MKKVIGFIFIFTAMIIWGTTFVAMKYTLNAINPGFLIFSRAIITFLVLLPFSIKYFKLLAKKELLLILSTGLIVGLGYLIQTIGMKYTTPGKSAFLEDAYCIIVPLLTCILLKKPPTIKNVVSIILSIIGIIVISLDSINGVFGIGEILSIIAGMLYGVNITLTGLYSKKCNPICFTCLQFLMISIVSLIYSLSCETISSNQFTSESIIGILYLGLICTALAWVLRNYAQRILPPITIGIVLPLTAVVGAFISVLFKEDTLNYMMVVGGILLTISVLIDSINIKKNKPTNGIIK